MSGAADSVTPQPAAAVNRETETEGNIIIPLLRPGMMR